MDSISFSCAKKESCNHSLEYALIGDVLRNKLTQASKLSTTTNVTKITSARILYLEMKIFSYYILWKIISGTYEQSVVSLIYTSRKNPVHY